VRKAPWNQRVIPNLLQLDINYREESFGPALQSIPGAGSVAVGMSTIVLVLTLAPVWSEPTSMTAAWGPGEDDLLDSAPRTYSIADRTDQHGT
jgi:hypothetical protein